MPYLLNLRQINILPPNENTAEEIAKARRDIADVMGMDADDIELLTEDIEEENCEHEFVEVKNKKVSGVKMCERCHRVEEI